MDAPLRRGSVQQLNTHGARRAGATILTVVAGFMPSLVGSAIEASSSLREHARDMHGCAGRAVLMLVMEEMMGMFR